MEKDGCQSRARNGNKIISAPWNGYLFTVTDILFTVADIKNLGKGPLKKPDLVTDPI
jgi:hypothetical protein